MVTSFRCQPPQDFMLVRLGGGNPASLSHVMEVRKVRKSPRFGASSRCRTARWTSRTSSARVSSRKARTRYTIPASASSSTLTTVGACMIPLFASGMSGGFAATWVRILPKGHRLEPARLPDAGFLYLALSFGRCPETAPTPARNTARSPQPRRGLAGTPTAAVPAGEAQRLRGLRVIPRWREECPASRTKWVDAGSPRVFGFRRGGGAVLERPGRRPGGMPARSEESEIEMWHHHT